MSESKTSAKRFGAHFSTSPPQLRFSHNSSLSTQGWRPDALRIILALASATFAPRREKASLIRSGSITASPPSLSSPMNDELSYRAETTNSLIGRA